MRRAEQSRVMTAHTGVSKSTRPGVPPARPLQRTVHGSIHQLAFVRVEDKTPTVQRVTCTWKCCCGESITADARHREDGGEALALDEHVAALYGKLGSEPGHAEPPVPQAASQPAGVRGLKQRLSASGLFGIARRASPSPPRMISSSIRKRPGSNNEAAGPAELSPGQPAKLPPGVVSHCPVCRAAVSPERIAQHTKRRHSPS